MELAEFEARRLRHGYLGTEHFLLGLVAEGEGVAAVVLTQLAGDLNAVRAAIESAVPPGKSEVNPADLDITPRAERAVVLAEEESRALGHLYLGTEHLLLGLIREGDGIAARVLEGLGIEYEVARQAVIGALTGAGVAEPVVTRGHVITCRVDARDLDAIDVLVEAGVRSTRSDAAAWLIHAGIESNQEILDRVYGTVAEIRRLREEVARSVGADAPPDAASG
jgi:ATP-dependent Clp protease ATP-binding subunit ClpC